MIPVCAFAAGTSDTTTETATVDEAKSPQYGGTFTYYGFANNDPPSPDIADGQYFATRWIAPIAEKILVGGIETYGPMGTDEYGFRAVSYIPDAYLEGKLIESWEITPDKVYWHVRQGIHWAADNVDFMENREMTGEDVALDLISFWKSAWGGRFDGMIADVRTEGKYTVVIEFENYSHNFMYFAGYEDRAYVTPPEVLENNPEKWGNQVGTGAWMFEEWVVGSHMSYVRNPNYWDSTTIDGVEYKMPFIDRVVLPIIPDTSTQIAALRTGKLDMHHGVPTNQQASLERTTPNLLSAIVTSGVTQINLKCSVPPFDNVDVRRAMMVGTDIAAFKRLAQMEDQPTHSYPANPYDPSIYTPLDELPEETQMLYDYDPEKAMKMLADAGYPDGLEIEFWAESTPTAQDYASLLKDVWAKIGVEVTIVTHDGVTLHQYRTTGTYNDTISNGMPISNPLPIVTAFAKTGGTWNYGLYSNSTVDDLADKIGKELDVQTKNSMYKEAFQIILDEVASIPTNLGVGKFYWWPWLRNYSGEYAIDDDSGFFAVLPYIWLDQDLKTEMGY